ncbi:MAG: 16S rRNA (guanine(966)-N(2))-methyltransferase RsmD [Burkholderiaceae bacterium]
MKPQGRPAAGKAPARAAAKQSPARPAGEVRIVGGLWKRTKLPVADRPGLRPTPDRVRETLFNWLGQDLAGWRCLDAFAGTGALGFEAASRGAAEVVMVEQDAGLVKQLAATKAKLEASAVTIERGDGVAAIRRLPGLDLVFLDPPFDAPLFAPSLEAAAAAVKPGGFVYLEAPEAWTDERLAPHPLKVHRHLKAGAVHAHLLQRTA